MTISSEMDAALLALAMATRRAGDPALQEQLVATQQRFEELLEAIRALEELCGLTRPGPAVMVPPGWPPQRPAEATDLTGGVVVMLDHARFARRAAPRA